MKTSNDTREKIVRVADRLIRMRGYNAFSYKDIATTLSIKNAAVHYHFQTKEELGVHVVETEIGLFRTYIQTWTGLPPGEQLSRLFDTFRNYNRGGLLCMVGSFSADYASLPDPVKAKVRELSTYIAEWVTTVLDAGRRAGTLRFEGTPDDRALLILADLISSLLLSRVMGTNAFDRVSNQLLHDLQLHPINHPL